MRSLLEIRRSADLGRTCKGPLVGIHHFSFAGFQDPRWIEWGLLRAVHRYRLTAGGEREPAHYAGFDVLTLVESGRLIRTGNFEQREALVKGSAEVVQAGSGALIGERAGRAEDAIFTEIWLKSSNAAAARRSYLASPGASIRTTVASDQASGSALRLTSPATVERIMFQPGERRAVVNSDHRRSYIVILSGSGRLQGEVIQSGDAAALLGSLSDFDADEPSELLVVHC